MKADSNVTHLPVIPAATEMLPLIPDGIYSVVYVAHETSRYFGRSYKATYWFRIVDFGDYFGAVIPRYYNVKRLAGKAGRNGNFVPGRSSDFLREFCKISTAPVKRLDRLPLSNFQNLQIKARVRTVSIDRRQRDLAAQLRYSVIGELLGVDR